jgi:hypothetical protein
MRSVRFALLALCGCWVTAAGAQEVEQPLAPDLEFLEYLGAWAEDDDEWLAIEEWQKDEAAEPGEDVPGSEAEKDDDDESE